LVLLAPGISAQPVEGPARTEAEFERMYKERIIKEKLNGVYIPKNLDDALQQLDKLSSAESKAKYKSIPEDSICAVMHNRVGQWMIVNWGFYGGSRLSHYLRSAGISFPDDMADFLLIAFHRRLHGKPIQIKDLATEFKQRRKEEHAKEKASGKVIHQETRKRKN
jgi:hypothetical protein